jgi:hypothetical protein
MESDRHDDGIFWTPNETFEAEETSEGLVDWFPIADSFPEMLWCMHHPERGTYICCSLPEEKEAFGLVTFSSLDHVEKFMESLVRRDRSKNGFIPALRTFSEARGLAKERDGVQAVMLLDDPKKTHLHYVKASHE